MIGSYSRLIKSKSLRQGPKYGYFKNLTLQLETWKWQMWFKSQELLSYLEFSHSFSLHFIPASGPLHLFLPLPEAILFLIYSWLVPLLYLQNNCLFKYPPHEVPSNPFMDASRPIPSNTASYPPGPFLSSECPWRQNLCFVSPATEQRSNMP